MVRGVCVWMAASVSFSVVLYLLVPGTCGPKKDVFRDTSAPCHSLSCTSLSLAVGWLSGTAFRPSSHPPGSQKLAFGLTSECV